MLETLDSAAAAAGTLAPATDSKTAGRAVVDTSAPFESVKEAIDLFGGSSMWKPQLVSPENHHCFEEVDLLAVEKLTSKLAMDLVSKERETLDVLKELEMTKKIVDELKLKLQKGTSEAIQIPEINSDDRNTLPILDSEEQHQRNPGLVESADPSIITKQSPGMILMELKQAKLNLNRTTSDLAGIRASVELLYSKIDEEKRLIEKTRERLSSNTSKVSFLEEDLSRKLLELQQTNEAKCMSCSDPSDITSQIKQLNSEKEQYKKMTEAAQSEVSKLVAEIEQTKASIQTANIRCFAAKKVEEAAKAAEAIALAQIKVLTDSNNSVHQNPSQITLPIEEYVMLTLKAQEADEMMKNKIESALLQVEEANKSSKDLLVKVEEVTGETETSRKALEEALNREECANSRKLAVESALRTWRSEHEKRRYAHNSTKFKNTYPSQNRKDSSMFDVNGLSLHSSGPKSSLKSTLSIGQILSRKLMNPGEYEAEVQEKTKGTPKVSLGEILSRRHGLRSPQRPDADIASKQRSDAKRKSSGFSGFQLHFAKTNKRSKKKKQSCSPRVNCGSKLVAMGM